MKNWILGGFLACLTSGGVAFVLAKNSTDSHCGLCVNKPAADAPAPTALPEPEPASAAPTVARLKVGGCCDHCGGGVVDVADLDQSFRAAGVPHPVVSFEEPPIAKPRGEVTPVKFETPAAPVEVAPMPRLAE